MSPRPVRRDLLRVAVLASGKGTNLQAIVDACAAGRVPARVAVVISDRKEAPALERARRAQVPAVWLPPGRYPGKEAYYDEVAGILAAHRVELVALAGFMRLLPASFVARYRWRILNVHPSLLPAFRGLGAPAQALEHGVKVSGCTVHFVDEGMDTGPIVLQAAVPVHEGDTPADLAARIQEEEHRLYPRAIGLFAQGRLRLEGRRVRILPGPGAEGGS